MADGSDPMFLRVHSKDLYEHIAQEVGECLETGLYTDITIRCKGGETLHAHRLVLSAISPYFKLLLAQHDVSAGDTYSIELPDVEFTQAQRLLEVVYNGAVEATMDEISDLILFAHSLYIKIPVSEDIIDLLDLTLPELRTLPHIKDVWGDETDIKRRKLGDPNTPQYFCEICKSSYSHPGNFKQHLLKHEREANGLGKVKNRPSLPGPNSHLNNVLHSAFADRVDHGDRNLDANIKMYECEQCGRVFKHPGNFKQHQSSHFRAASGVKQQKMKLPELPKVPVPQSSIAGVSSSSPPKAVLNPRPTYTNASGEVVDPVPCPIVTRWKCNHCMGPTFFQSREKLRQHVAANHRGHHLGIKRAMPLPPNLIPSMPLAPSAITTASYKECEICHQLFDTESQLAQHMSTHVTIKEEPSLGGMGSMSNELTYHCDEPGCTQAFSKEIWVRKHKETFHEISPDKLNGSEGIYECRICKKVFSKSNKLSAHMRVHRYDAPQNHYRYPCDICGKRFTRPQHVNRHKLLHTGERLHKCKDCNASFAREDKLKYHMVNECEYSVINMENIDYELDEGELMVEETITP